MSNAMMQRRIREILIDQASGSGVIRRRRAVKKRSSGSSSAWIRHVKKYARDHNISYGEALIKARSSYKGSGIMKRRSRSKVVRRKRGGVLIGGVRRRRVGSKTSRKRVTRRKPTIASILRRLR